MNISNLPIQNPALQQMQEQAGNAVGGGNQSEDFAQTLMDVLKEVNDAQGNALQVKNDFLTGQHGVDVHDLKIAMERASIAMDLTVQIRNKLLDAYQEISRMQV